MNELHELIIKCEDNFTFDEKDIDQACVTPNTWKEFVRKKEVELLFSIFKGHIFDKTIEFGAGEGLQAKIIAKYSNSFICSYLSDNTNENHGNMKINENIKNIIYMQNDMQDLNKIKDNTFDLIYTSNTLEHVPNIEKALSECERVLKKDGVMLHIMPNRTWKFFSFLLNTIRFHPPIHVHGTSSNHISELYYFGQKPWEEKFNNAGLDVLKVVRMPFYTGTQNKFKFIIKAGNKLKLSSSYAYFIRKCN